MFKKFICAFKRIKLFLFCTHFNCGRTIQFDNTTRITICKLCGTVMQIHLAECDKNKYTKIVDFDNYGGIEIKEPMYNDTLYS